MELDQYLLQDAISNLLNLSGKIMANILLKKESRKQEKAWADRKTGSHCLFVIKHFSS